MKDTSAPHLRSLVRDPSNLRILVRIAAVPHGEIRRASFPANNIDYLREDTDESCVIVLRSGLSVHIAMPLDTLYEKIYHPDFRQGDTLDLTKISAQRVDPPKAAPAEKLSTTFNKSAPLKIVAPLRKPESNSVSIIEFSEADVRFYNIDTTARSKSGQSIKIYFHDVMLKRLPFKNLKDEYVMLDMPNDDFMAELHKAKKQGNDTLDLCALFIAKPSRYGFDPQ